MKKIYALIIVAAFACMAINSMATPSGCSVTVKGKVVDCTGDPIIGGVVCEKGTYNCVVTDVDGNYSIMVACDATLVYSFIGLVTQEVPMSKREYINVTLQEDISVLE
jgi:hypothetical protein